MTDKDIEFKRSPTAPFTTLRVYETQDEISEEDFETISAILDALEPVSYLENLNQPAPAPAPQNRPSPENIPWVQDLLAGRTGRLLLNANRQTVLSLWIHKGNICFAAQRYGAPFLDVPLKREAPELVDTLVQEYALRRRDNKKGADLVLISEEEFVLSSLDQKSILSLMQRTLAQAIDQEMTGTWEEDHAFNSWITTHSPIAFNVHTLLNIEPATPDFPNIEPLSTELLPDLNSSDAIQAHTPSRLVLAHADMCTTWLFELNDQKVALVQGKSARVQEARGFASYAREISKISTHTKITIVQGIVDKEAVTAVVDPYFISVSFDPIHHSGRVLSFLTRLQEEM